MAAALLPMPALASPSVSVPDFKNEVGSLVWWSPRVSRQLADALSNELTNAGGLRVVERQNLKEVLSEQELAELGIVRPDGAAAQSGQMTGAQYIILGRINGYEEGVEQKQSGSGLRFLGFGGSKTVSEAKAYVSMDLRVVDASTGEVVGARTVEGRATSTAKEKDSGGSLLPLAGLVGGLTRASGTGAYALGAAATFSYEESSSEANRTPAAKAIRAALIDGADYVNCLLVLQDGCLTAYQQQDAIRRARTRDVLQLE
ncbi:CsgG/HfaB family protein [Synechococcus sp. RSCCF101]|uniref:CsgG/HfaB family protein n=1 Tax=Synechococcus sp. RSCCF101 TaxID=2511069 RepID=UPI001CD920E1|nr:LPS assembly lipoprotein LptE [Synechococcus sp. RSCCF101]